jgi:hypothetical protein
MSAKETENAQEVLVCAVCSGGLRPAEPIGNAEGKPAHLECWLSSRRLQHSDEDVRSPDNGHHAP